MARFCSGGWWAGSWRELLGACVPAGDGPSSVQPVLQPGQGCFYPEPPLAAAPEIAAGLTAAVPVQPALRQEAPCVLRSQPLCSRWARAPGSGTWPCGAAGSWQPAGRTQGLGPARAGSGGCGVLPCPVPWQLRGGSMGSPPAGWGTPRCSAPAQPLAPLGSQAARVGLGPCTSTLGAERCLLGWLCPMGETGCGAPCSQGAVLGRGGQARSPDHGSWPLSPQPCGTSQAPTSITSRCRSGRRCTSCRPLRVRVPGAPRAVPGWGTQVHPAPAPRARAIRPQGWLTLPPPLPLQAGTAGTHSGTGLPG